MFLPTATQQTFTQVGESFLAGQTSNKFCWESHNLHARLMLLAFALNLVDCRGLLEYRFQLNTVAMCD